MLIDKRRRKNCIIVNMMEQSYSSIPSQYPICSLRNKNSDIISLLHALKWARQDTNVFYKRK